MWQHPFFSCPLVLLLIHTICVLMCAGRVAGRPKSAAKCTEWSARISGAPPAAGKKPVSASPTKRKQQERKKKKRCVIEKV